MKLRHLLSIGLLLLLGACGQSKYRPSWEVSLSHTSKEPYGAYLAYQSLKEYFPGVPVEPLSRGYRYNSMNAKMQYGSEGTSLMVLSGLDFYVSEDELDYLMRYARAGNELFIFSSRLDSKLEEQLGCTQVFEGSEEYPLSQGHDGSQNLAALWNIADSSVRYGFRGRWLLGNFSIDSNAHRETALEETAVPVAAEDSNDETTEEAIVTAYDTTVTTEPEPDGSENTSEDIYATTEEESSDDDDILGPVILGRSKNGPDFIRYQVGSGHITLHAAPLVLSNYFLIRQPNRHYLDYIWKTFPEDIHRIYWHDYLKHSAEKSSLAVILRYPATRWALVLGLIALLVFVLFEVKRRQRIIPIVAPLENSSVSFVETVGRLYYNKGNHGNLAEKMVQHFLEHVRSAYFLNTNQLDDHFVRQLVVKSGQPESLVRSVVEMIHEIRLHSAPVNEDYLYQLYNSLQTFYKK